ncbi:hypothetical protein C4J81_00080 [Deltaproteobacteria bacterium Smac51]|nr:hypothetical protein C4J81_00080 [Deltaproteobacteria bacterium Smac51]
MSLDEKKPPSIGPLPSRGGVPDYKSENEQRFDWGYASWIVTPEAHTSGSASVGHIVFHPFMNDLKHRHFGEEQILYIISGHGRHVVNGREIPFQAGDVLHLPPFSHHQVTNESDSELHILAVYIPARFQARTGALEELNLEEGGGGLKSLIDLDDVREQLNKLALSMGQSIRLIAPDGSELIQSDNPPRLCRALGCRQAHCREHFLKAIRETPDTNDSRTFHCCGRVTSIIMPIGSGAARGFIKCGEFFLSQGDAEEMIRYLSTLPDPVDRQAAAGLLEGITVDKINMIYTAAANTLEVARYIAEMSLAMIRQRESESYRLSIMKARMEEARLKEALRESELKLLQSQLNPHFLFNTLNTISHMAYLDGAGRVSDLVCGLSDLLKAALGKVKSLIALAEELALLEQYLAIQKARFGLRLQTSITMDPALEDFLIPALTLQPIVENSIIHGVETSLDTCRVEIGISGHDRGLMITVDNDGPALAEADESGWGVGLRSVKARLRHHFGEKFRLELYNRRRGGVRTMISIER